MEGEERVGDAGGNPSFRRKRGFPQTPFLRKPLRRAVARRGFNRKRNNAARPSLRGAGGVIISGFSLRKGGCRGGETPYFFSKKEGVSPLTVSLPTFIAAGIATVSSSAGASQRQAEGQAEVEAERV